MCYQKMVLQKLAIDIQDRTQVSLKWDIKLSDGHSSIPKISKAYMLSALPGREGGQD